MIAVVLTIHNPAGFNQLNFGVTELVRQGHKRPCGQDSNSPGRMMPQPRHFPELRHQDHIGRI